MRSIVVEVAVEVVVEAVAGTVTGERVGGGGIRPSGGATEQHALVDGEGLQRAEVVRPWPRQVWRLDALGKSAAHLGVAESAQRLGQGALVLGRDEQPVDAVDHLLREGRDVAGEDRQTVRVAEDHVLGRRGRPDGQGEDVVAGEQRGQRVVGHVALADVHPACECRVGREAGDDVAAGAPDLSGDGQRHVRDRPHGAQEDVDPLVLTDESDSEQPGGTGPWAARDGVPARQVRGQVGHGHPTGAEVVRHPRLVGAVHEHRVDPWEEHRHEAGVADVRLVREDVVAHDHRLRSRTGRARHRAGGPEQHEVRGNDAKASRG